MKDDKMLSEDDLKRIEKDIEDTVAKKQSELETLVKAKEAEVMKV
jgi:ribosome recycling factor